MTRAKAILVGLACGIIVGQFVVWFSLMAANTPAIYVRHHTDLLNILTGARIIHEGDGRSLYDLDTQRSAQNRILAPYLTLDNTDLLLLPYIRLPFEAVLLAPLAQLPYELQYALWDALLVLAIGGSLWLLARALPVPAATRRVMFLIACSYPPVHASLWGGQSSPFLLLGLCTTFVAIKAGRAGWAGGGLLLLSLKLQVLPAIVLLVLLHRCWKALITWAGALTALSLAIMPVVGVGWPLQYLRFLVETNRLGEQAYINPGQSVTWRGFATAVAGGWAPWLVTPLYVALALASVGLLLWTWHRCRVPSSPVPDLATAYVPQLDLLWALAAVMAVLLALHQSPADLVVLIFAGWVGGAYIATSRWTATEARGWFGLIGADYLLRVLTWVLLAALIVPKVLVLTGAMALLARQAAGTAAPAVAPAKPAEALQRKGL